MNCILLLLPVEEKTGGRCLPAAGSLSSETEAVALTVYSINGFIIISIIMLRFQ